MISRAQLLALGVTPREIDQAVASLRLHVVWRGIYALGRPGLSREGRWLAAVLACGAEAALSHGSAARLWGLGDYERGHVEVSVPDGVYRRRPGIRVHRRSGAVSDDITEHVRIPVTAPARVVFDLAPRLSDRGLETVINEGANRDLFSPDELRDAAEDRAGQRGVRRVRRVLDRQTFRLTRSELERRYLTISDDAGLPTPQTRRWLNGFEVDFFYPGIGLVVETDGLRYHRTPAQQGRDRLRDQAHTAAGLTPLRFTHAQIRYEPSYVRDVLRRVAKRLLQHPLPQMG